MPKDESNALNELHLNLYKKLFTIDYVSDKDKYIIDSPFTFVNWVMIE